MATRRILGTLTAELTFRILFSFLLFLFVLLPFSAHGDNGPSNNSQISENSGAPLSSLAANEQHRQISTLVSYFRGQVASLMPGLQHVSLDPQHWMLEGLRQSAEGLGLISIEGGPRDASLTPFEDPSATLMGPPTPAAGEALWLAPNYHHKGFLPFNDAMEMGINLRHAVFNQALRFEMHPYYGQNWISERGYSGVETSIGIRRDLGILTTGKIALNYMNGDETLLDHGHGFDLHSELGFTDHVALHAGIRQNESSEIGNYVLLEWKLLSN